MYTRIDKGDAFLSLNGVSIIIVIQLLIAYILNYRLFVTVVYGFSYNSCIAMYQALHVICLNCMFSRKRAECHLSLL